MTDNNYYFVKTYFNGVLSGIAKLSVNKDTRQIEAFREFGINEKHRAIITFDSTYGDIYLYNLRIYKSAFTHKNVIDNYIADIHDADIKIYKNKVNNLFDLNGKISLENIRNLTADLGIPYVLFKGGSPLRDKKITEGFSFNADAPNY
jgi:hypothetical protein